MMHVFVYLRMYVAQPPSGTATRLVGVRGFLQQG
jgi:hypothetical protein